MTAAPITETKRAAGNKAGWSRIRPGNRPAAWIVGIAIAISLIALLPIGFVIDIAIETGWQTAIAMIIRPRVGELVINTVLLIVLTVPLCAIIGVVLAWLTERTDLPGRRLWSLLCTAPLALPAFVQSYAWVGLFPAFHGLVAAVLISLFAYFPFFYLPVAATLRRLDPAIEDVAASLGLTPWQIFFRAVLPQLRLAICGGALLVGLHLLAEYGLYAMIRFDTFTTAIFDQFKSTFNGPAANMLAGILVLCCLMLLTAEAGARGSVRYARIGAGSEAMPRIQHLTGTHAILCQLVPTTVTIAALGIPLIILARWLIAGGIAVWLTDELAPAVLQTLLYATIGAAITTVAAIPMAWLSIRAPSPFIRFLEGCNYVASSLPGIVVALALVTITIRIANPLYQTVATVLLAYLLMFLPLALISLRASIAQIPAELEDTARSLGRTPGQAIRDITLRLAAPGFAASAAMVFLAITNELTATLLLSPNGTRTLATGFWALTAEINYAAAAPYALIMVLLSLPWTWLLYRQSQRMSGR